MQKLTLDRAEMWDVRCPMSGAHFRVQFWDTHQEDRHGKRRMSVAIFEANPLFPNTFNLVLKTRYFYASYLHSCDGPEAAKSAVSFLDREDIDTEGLETREVSRHDEGFWLS